MFHYAVLSVNVDYTEKACLFSSECQWRKNKIMKHWRQLLSIGADIDLKANNGWTAKDFAIHVGKTPAVEILESYQ